MTWLVAGAIGTWPSVRGAVSGVLWWDDWGDIAVIQAITADPAVASAASRRADFRALIDACVHWALI